MFKLHAKLVAPLSAVLFALSLSPATYADVIAPALEIDSDGAGDYISGSASDLTIDGTVRSIISDFGPPPVVVDIPDVDFLLTADGNGNNGVDYFYTNGTISAGSYLNTTFSSMTISPFAVRIVAVYCLSGSITWGGAAWNFFGSSSTNSIKSGREGDPSPPGYRYPLTMNVGVPPMPSELAES